MSTPTSNPVGDYPPTPYHDAQNTTPYGLNYELARFAVVLHASTGDMTVAGARAYTFLCVRRPAAALDDDGAVPPPQQALRLAYYMRECGYDVRAVVVPELAMIWLVVRVDGVDWLYWAQSVRSGRLLSVADMREIEVRCLDL